MDDSLMLKVKNSIKSSVILLSFIAHVFVICVFLDGMSSRLLDGELSLNNASLYVLAWFLAVFSIVTPWALLFVAYNKDKDFI